VDFLGWVHFPHRQVLRTSTKWRMFKKLEQDQKEAVIASYLGMLSHGNGHKLSEKIKKVKNMLEAGIYDFKQTQFDKDIEGVSLALNTNIEEKIKINL
jgi:hypothetical protein